MQFSKENVGVLGGDDPKAIARRNKEGHIIFYKTVECNMDGVEELLKDWEENEIIRNDNEKITD